MPGVVKDFTQNILAGHKEECQVTTRKLLDSGAPIFEIYEGLYKESLYEVGRLWESNKISVASEHLATALVEGIMNNLYASLIPKKTTKKKVVLGCVENEHHQVGIKMAGDVFESQGWETFFLGSGVPNESLVKFIAQTKPDMVALSLSVYFNMPSLLGLLSKIHEEFPGLPVVIGGQAFQQMVDAQGSSFDLTKYHPDIRYFDGLKSLEQALINMANS